MKYEQILKALVGIPTLKAKVSDPFPLVGDNITITSNSKWIKQHNYIIDNGLEKQYITKDCVLGESEQTVTPQKQGEFVQNISVQNDSGEYSVNKAIYPMNHSTEPYFNIKATEIIRVGETGKIQIIPDNGYDMERPHIINIRLYKENETQTPIKTFNIGTYNINYCEFIFSEVQDRGIYDVEVDIIDTATEVKLSKRINKLITVTPALSPRQDAIEFYMPDAKDDPMHTWVIDGSDVPPGSTIVLKYNPEYQSGYPMRLRMQNFVGTWENPIIVTVDTEETFEWNWFSWWGWYMDYCHYIVIDGRGYNNLTKGLKMIAMPESNTNAMQFTTFDDEIEMFEVEINGADFAGMMIKTDPDVNDPNTWYDNFKFNRLLIHHCYIHDTVGEGSYLGHFSSGWYTNTNSDGEQVQYRAHHLYNCRIYRNVYENQGFDSFQLNNAEDAEICYNTFINGGNRLELDQTGTLAISMSGKIYNNVIYNSQGPGIQLSWLGPLEFFNNLILQGGATSSGIYNLAGAEPPSKDGSFIHNTYPFIIHNNVILSTGAILASRMTNYTDNIQIYDNFFVYSSYLYGGQYPESMAKWIIKNNYTKEMLYPYDYEELDSLLKLGDSESLDYRIASTSPLVEGGCGDSFKFDFNGYKNWYNTVFPIGAYLGKYRDPSVIDSDFALGYILINNGDTTTKVATVNVYMKYKGDITHYRLSEIEDLSSTEWIPFIENNIAYTFSSTGLKTLYCQIKDDSQQSEIKSASIQYLDSPLVLESIEIENGADSKYGTTVSVQINYTGSVNVASYKIGESATLEGESWKPYSQNIVSYTFDSIGSKTLYVMLKDEYENTTDIKSDSINIQAPRQANISIGWKLDEIENQHSIYDENYNINKVYFSRSGDTYFKWNTQQIAGKIQQDLEDNYGVTANYSTDGYVTGDDSGIYPDEIIKHLAYTGGNENYYTYRTASIEIEPGTYRISLYMSLKEGARQVNELKVQLISNEQIIDVPIPANFDLVGNKDTWLTQDIQVSSTGNFKIKWGKKSSNSSWIMAPLNVIRIEEL